MNTNACNFAWLENNFKDVEFFFVAMAIDGTELQLDIADSACIDLVKTPGFVCLSSLSKHHSSSLAIESSDAVTIFRGYELDVCISSYDGRITEIHPKSLENGVFAFIRYCKHSRSLIVRSDLFGVSPLFYRIDNGIFFLSSHNVLLRQPGDELDTSGEISLLNYGFSFDQHTCHVDIKRFPPAMQASIDASGRVVWQPWGSWNDLGQGDRLIDDEAAQEVESAFRESMQRCIALTHGDIILPLSSGYDSRRIFGYLNESNVDFETITAQAFKRIGDRYFDIDGRFGPEVARRFGRPNRLVPARTPEGLAADLARRDLLIGSESLMHGWSMALFEALRENSTAACIYDGLGGDALGNSGFVFPGFHVDYKNNIDILFNETAKPGFARALGYQGAVYDDYRKGYRDYLDSLPSGPNQCELAFLLLRTRRSISPWILMNQAPGSLVVFPYLELGHVRKTLEFYPGEKYRVFFQKYCLKKYYPDCFSIPGSRAMPAVLPPVPQDFANQLDAAERQYLFSEEIIELIGSRVNDRNKFFFSLFRSRLATRYSKPWLFETLARYLRSETRTGYFLQ